ncbi:hypothetical protein, partial [Jiangella muralis]|uniref:hypothetical protein n=1 Tax=Jiangella muralis TaxID=702383 RepID=UPI001470206D
SRLDLAARGHQVGEHEVAQGNWSRAGVAEIVDLDVAPAEPVDQEPANMKVTVTLDLDVTIAGWMLDYGVTEAEARAEAAGRLAERIREVVVHEDADRLGLYTVAGVTATRS